jgi:hypothetical protein
VVGDPDDPEGDLAVPLRSALSAIKTALHAVERAQRSSVGPACWIFETES